MEATKQYEEESLLARSHPLSGSREGNHSIEVDLDAFDNVQSAYSYPNFSRPTWWPLRSRHNSKVIKASQLGFSRSRRKRLRYSRICRLLFHVPSLILVLIVICSIFFPSYSHPPQRYTDLRQRVLQSSVEGAANPNNEKVFIAASLYDQQGQLVSGDWGQSVRYVIDILGHENVFLSIYENDPDDKSKQALIDFRQSVLCDSSIVYEHLDSTKLHHATMPDGSQRLQRISFLAEVRNRALRPLDEVGMEAYHTRWDKLLYLNDVAFDPVDAANLLFNTNLDESTGKARYRAACAVDFVNPFKFYDTFASRDAEGYSMGVPFYPWFTGAGNGTSKEDVLCQTDTVKVKSCWGGMVAFEAKWFQPHLYDNFRGDLAVPHTPASGVVEMTPNHGSKDVESAPDAQGSGVFNDVGQTVNLRVESQVSNSTHESNEVLAARSSHTTIVQPLRFRSETDLYWEASECCLILADLTNMSLSDAVKPGNQDNGIYLNPYVRTAYSRHVLKWLPFTKRFERLYTPIHSLISSIAMLPKYNPRRLEQPGDEVVDRVWQWDEESLAALRNGTVGELSNGLRGSFQEIKRTAQPGQFCGTRKLQYIKDHARVGERTWGSAKVPIVD